MSLLPKNRNSIGSGKHRTNNKTAETFAMQEMQERIQYRDLSKKQFESMPRPERPAK